MNIPNRLTVARIVLAGIFFLFAVPNILWCRAVATFIFLVATATDWLDGFLARKLKKSSAFGALADPLADKLLVVAALTVFLNLRDLDIPAWTIFLTIARELIIGSLRALAALKGTVLAAERWGKWKMGVQTGCILAILFILDFRTLVISHPLWLKDGFLWLARTSDWPRYLSYVIVASTWASGVTYLYKNRALLQESWQ